MARAQQLMALSPLDGRYQSQVAELTAFFSEFALIKNRVEVEVRYLLFLAQHQVGLEFKPAQVRLLKQLLATFSLEQAERIKELEQTTRHDVKAVEYFLRDFFHQHHLPGSEWIHFALTSEDTNSLAIGLGLRSGVDQVVLPSIKQLILSLASLIKVSRDQVMLGRTHGQPAVPTTMGKEILVFAHRLATEYHQLAELPVAAKLTGAIGNFNAHTLALPEYDWLALSRQFVSEMGLQPVLYTTQIVPAESYVRIFDSLHRLNSIVIDLDQDMWRYISDGYLLQAKTKEEVGSSTMPQKVNPIDFENSEGNAGIANSLLRFFSQKLPISRLQRDLSDSVVKRQFGVALGHCVMAYQSAGRGLAKVTPNPTVMTTDLARHPDVVSEGLQTLLRQAGDETGYEQLKELTQGKTLTSDVIGEWVDTLSVSDQLKQKLRQVTSDSYLGLVAPLIDSGLAEIYTLIGERKHASEKK